MKKPVAKFLIKVAKEKLPDQDVFIEEEYEDNKSWGKTYAIICPNPIQLLCVCVNYANEHAGMKIPKFNDFRHGVMGYDKVIY